MDGHQITDAAAAKSFALAGKSIFTLVSKKTGARFTYKVKRSKKPSGPSHFVQVRTDTNGLGDYSYLGAIWDSSIYGHGRRSDIPPDDLKARAAKWIFSSLVSGKLPEGCEFWHEGRCGRCGRPLTVPASIASGIGPECERKMECVA